MTKKDKIPIKTKFEYEAIGKLLEETYLLNKSTKLKVLWASFLRGLFYGLGIFIAGTLVVGILISFLSRFDEVPVIGPFVDKIVTNLDSSKTTKP